MSLVLKNLSDILISEDEDLNQNSVNSKIKALVENDKLIYSSFGSTIGRWHCAWYYDSNVKGYSKGDLVWLNVEDPESFVRKHYAIVKSYTDLNPEVLIKLPAFDSTNDAVIAKYLNALSGYVDSRSSNVKPLNPIFDLGDYSKPIQLAVSLLDNNKKLVSDDSAWKKLFVDDSTSEEKIDETEEEAQDFVLQQHLIDYHLSGQEEYVAAQLSDYLSAQDGQEYDSLPSSWYAKYDSASDAKQYGVDYVVYSIRKPIASSGEVSQYQAVRYWKSGWIEHFGTIATSNEDFSLSDGKFFQIPFDWNISDKASDAKIYETGALAQTTTSIVSANETDSNMVYPKDGLINIVVERSGARVANRDRAAAFKDSSYNISISPVFQDQNGIQADYIEASYGTDQFKQNWNSNFLTNEIVDSLKTSSRAVMRLDTRVLAPYISYYATGIGGINV